MPTDSFPREDINETVVRETPSMISLIGLCGTQSAMVLEITDWLTQARYLCDWVIAHVDRNQLRNES